MADASATNAQDAMTAEEAAFKLQATGINSDGHRVLLGCPGPSYHFEAVNSIIRAITQTPLAKFVHLSNSCDTWDAFNDVWVTALNLCEMGQYTHFAMLHSDIAAQGQWLNELLGELDKTGAALVSAIAPIKDRRGVTSSGIGDPENCWGPLRRFTMAELDKFPETFNATHAGYPGGILLHNTGCWVADMRHPCFYKTDETGALRCNFDFRHRIYREPERENRWINVRESEDWYFSRQIHELGGISYITRKAKLYHLGTTEFPNWGPWGNYQEGDLDTMKKWNPERWAELQKEAAEKPQENVALIPAGDLVTAHDWGYKPPEPEASPSATAEDTNATGPSDNEA